MPNLKAKQTVLDPAVRSFYHWVEEPVAGKFCQGLACFVARGQDPAAWAQPQSVHCLGKCHLAPASTESEGRPRIEVQARAAVVLERLLQGGASRLEAYTAGDGYETLRKARDRPPEELVCIVERSGLRGRGGAGFPTGRKWRAVLEQRSEAKCVVANADEGDPGAYLDRFLLEEDPHGLLESMAIAGHAVGATRGIIYLRKEYPAARHALERALAEARAAGWIDDPTEAGRSGFGIELVVGKGSYVCGEETALLNALEGRRPEVRLRPPYPAERGLFGQPTLVNNVETLAAIPWILRHGDAAYRALGFADSRGTKVVSLNSLFRRPGLYEIEFGLPVQAILEELGGGLRTGAIEGVIIGGPLAGVLPPRCFDTPFGFEELAAVGARVGHGGIIAFDRRSAIIELLQHVAAFAAFESCGKCIPCRLGSRRLSEIGSQILRDGSAPASARVEWEALTAALLATSLCGLGTGLGELAMTAWRYYGKELQACFR